MRHRPARTLLLLVSALLLGVGGAGCQQDGGLVISVVTDLPTTELQKVRLSVRRDGQTQSEVEWPLVGSGSVSLPGTFYLFTPRFDSPIQIELEGFLAGDSEQPGLRRTSTVNLIAGQNLFLRMALERACLGDPCAQQPDTTCIGGVCEPELVPADQLTEYREGEEARVECGPGFIDTATGEPLGAGSCGEGQGCREGLCVAGFVGSDGGPPLDAPTDASTDTATDAPIDAPVDVPADLPECTPEPSFEEDPANCGRCGRDCQGGGCVAGQCEPVVVAKGLNYPFGNAICGDFLFHIEHDGSTLGKIPLDGTGSTTVAEPCFPHGLACAGDDVYVSSECSGEVFQVSGAGALTPVAGGLDTPNYVALRTDLVTLPELYVITLNISAGKAAGVAQIQLPGAPRAVAPYPVDEENLPFDEARGSIAFSDTDLFLQVSGSRTIRRYPLDDLTSAGTVVGSTSCRVAGLAVSLARRELWWLEADHCSGEDQGRLFRRSLDSDDEEVVLEELSGPSSLALGDDGVYFTSFDEGTIQFLAFDQTVPVTLATGQSGPSSVVVAPASVFWSNEGTGEIARVARP